MTVTIAPPDLSARPLRCTCERSMQSSPEVLFRAWTEQFDRWFAAPGSLLMKGEVNTVFFLRPTSKVGAIRTTAGFSSWRLIAMCN